MVIQCDILFDQNVKKPKSFDIKVKHFVISEIELFSIDEKSIPVIVENLPLRLLFFSNNEEDRLYLDFFDSLPYDSTLTDETGIPYVSPSTEEYIIYENTNDYLTLVPGYYKLTLVKDSISYYSLLKVTSKQINEMQWLAMRDEIEQTVSSLAQDALQKRLGNETSSKGNITNNIFNKIKLINKQFPSWISVLNFIENNPKSKIEKTYVFKERNSITNPDPITIRNISKTFKPRIKAGCNHISFDLPENIELKYYIAKTAIESRKMIDELDTVLSNIISEINELQKFDLNKNALAADRLNKVYLELTDSIKLLTRVRNRCLELLEKDFLRDINERKIAYSITAFSSNIRIKKVKDFYKLFGEQKLSINLSTEYQYCWKRTDKLYELWGYIHFIKAFISLGYEFDTHTGSFFEISENILQGKDVSFFSENAKVVFRKGTLKVEVVYDTPLPYKSVAIEQCPLKAETVNNRPDIRIDVYEQDMYLGTILGDFKYRPLQNFWSSGAFNPNYDTNSKKQLFEYKNSIVSDYFPKRISAVREVWVMYPKNEKNRNISSDVDRIRLVELTPLNENNEFFNLLSESLKELVEEADMIKFFASQQR